MRKRMDVHIVATSLHVVPGGRAKLCCDCGDVTVLVCKVYMHVHEAWLEYADIVCAGMCSKRSQKSS